jgi:hypothetical protein
MELPLFFVAAAFSIEGAPDESDNEAWLQIGELVLLCEVKSSALNIMGKTEHRGVPLLGVGRTLEERTSWKM